MIFQTSSPTVFLQKGLMTLRSNSFWEPPPSKRPYTASQQWKQKSLDPNSMIYCKRDLFNLVQALGVPNLVREQKGRWFPHL
jgi:hypothetical protein